MNVEHRSPTERELEAAKRFLNTVVIIDDHIVGVVERPERPASVSAPTPSPDMKPLNAIVDVDSRPQESATHEVNLRQISDAFAEEGIVCGTLLIPRLPDSDSEQRGSGREQPPRIVERASRVAANADVVLVDWSMHGDRGAFACTLFKSMDDSVSSSARRQLAVVYTGEHDLDRIMKALGERFEGSRRNGRRVAMKNGTTIVVLRKPGGQAEFSEVPDDRLPYSELPDRIVEEFALQAGGILGSAAMVGLAEVRANTHRILQQFPREADAEYIVHRAATSPSSDAEEQVGELLTAVVGDVLAGVTWSKQVSRAAIGERLESVEDDERVRYFHGLCEPEPKTKKQRKLSNYINEDRFDSLDFALDVFDVRASRAPDSGDEPEHAARLEDARKLASSDPKIYRRSVSELARSLGAPDSEDRCLKYAALSYSRLASENVESRVLQLGTIVRVAANLISDVDDRYLHGEHYYMLCMLPVCDAARFEDKSGRVPFLLLEVVDDLYGEGKLNLLVTSKGSHLALRYSASVCSLWMCDVDRSETPSIMSQDKATETDPTTEPEEQRVWGETFGSSTWQFKPSYNLEFVAELRPLVAQRIAQNMSSNAGRVGLMENEFVRRRAK